MSRILTAIYEPEFSNRSYGYRPERSVHDAVKSVTDTLQFGPYGYVVEADIEKFFDQIDHDWRLKMLEHRIRDRAFVGLIRKWLKEGILERDGRVVHPERGSPQGASVSPVLANIYLHYVLDLWFEKVVRKQCRGKAWFCRYADDFICAFQYKSAAEWFYTALAVRIGKFGLRLSASKTRIIPFSRTRIAERRRFDFLGFEFRWGVPDPAGQYFSPYAYVGNQPLNFVGFGWENGLRAQAAAPGSLQLVNHKFHFLLATLTVRG